ncbi:MAG: hypothetical protein M3041_00825 [Acidobacteriota bacterium]|nr:hypothetical protein [Acidobacteriota bacterium]
MALTPSVIDSRLGPIGLLGIPNLEAFAKETIDAPDVSRVNDYIAATTPPTKAVLSRTSAAAICCG